MHIIKTTGHLQPFSEAKFRRSLRRAGADPALTATVAAQVLRNPVQSTDELHDRAFAELVAAHRGPVAARYDLKRALFRLGPSGFPFEQYVAEVFRALGYDARTNQILHGRCVDHEVDIVLENDREKIFVECKYHNGKHLRSDVKVALYIKARFDDVREQFAAEGKEIRGMIVTNTEFTKDAVAYARCAGHLWLTGWRHPRGHSLAELIDRTGLHPVTALTSITDKQKGYIIDNGVVLCRDLADRPDLLTAAGVRGQRAEHALREARAVCELRDTAV